MRSDTHFHLDPEDNPQEIFAAARNAGVTLLIVQGTSLDDCQRTVDLADAEHGIYVTAGLHPHVAKTFTDLQPFREWHKTNGCVAVGEIGLDYFYDFSPHEDQKRVFEIFLQFAVELDKPPVIHCRSAFDDCYDIVKNTLPSGYPFLIHSFADTRTEARKWLDLGAMLSFNGMATFKKSDNVREALAITPLDRILLETDSPYLAPVPYRGKRNTPANIPIIGRFVADQKCIEPEELAKVTLDNARRFFKI